MQRLLKAVHGLAVEGVQRVDGAGEVVEIGFGCQRQLRRHQLALRQLQRLGNLGLQRLLRASQRAAKRPVVLLRVVKAAKAVALQLADLLLQRLDHAFGIRRQLARRQNAHALGAHHAEFFAQHRRVYQRSQNQRMRVVIRVGLQAVGAEQGVV